jgi:hypothetical protein
MTNFALRPPPRRIARRSLGRRERRQLETDAELVSVAGVVGSRVVASSGRHVGKLDDLVLRWDPQQAQPPLAGPRSPSWRISMPSTPRLSPVRWLMTWNSPAAAVLCAQERPHERQ